MPIDVVCPKCGKDYRVKDERAGTRIRCKECQTAISVPALSQDDDLDNESDWNDTASQPMPGRSRGASATRKPSRTGAVTGAAAFTTRKIFGALAILLALFMLLGIGVQVAKGNMRAFGGLVVVAAVGGVGFKWLRT